MRDPDENVRNNAMRALLVLTFATPAPGRPVARVPYEPFIDFLNSPVWSDRNKASGALAELSRTRDPKLLDGLGARAAALFILARVAGRPDADVDAALANGDREGIIRAALPIAR